jgi:hypothetical protein
MLEIRDELRKGVASAQRMAAASFDGNIQIC